MNATCFLKGASSPYSIVIPLLLASLAFLPMAKAVTPPPDGGYPNENTAEGQDALFSVTIGYDDTAVGFEALFSNITGFENTATGSQALHNNIGGGNNTASGFQALFSNTQGFGNTATGAFALFANTFGGGNTATGGYALNANTGDNNTAAGFEALFQNTVGGGNTASGVFALEFNTTGNENTATGDSALQQNTAGSNNTATGSVALFFNSSGKENAAHGAGALEFNTTGSNNTAEGHNALLKNTTGNNNIALGNSAGARLSIGSNNIEIGNRGVHNDSNTIRIGTEGTQTQTFVAGISGTTVPTGVPVIVDTTGHLGTTMSSARFKDQIKSMDKASEAILALKPVTFHYKHELDPEAIPQFGLVAEDVAKVAPDLVARDQAGKPYTVRYEAVNAMLLNEFLKEHRKVEEQDATIVNQQKQISDLTANLRAVNERIDALTAAQQHPASE